MGPGFTLTIWKRPSKTSASRFASSCSARRLLVVPVDSRDTASLVAVINPPHSAALEHAHVASLSSLPTPVISRGWAQNNVVALTAHAAGHFVVHGVGGEAFEPRVEAPFVETESSADLHERDPPLVDVYSVCVENPRYSLASRMVR